MGGCVERYGPCFSFLTLPQVYYAGLGHRFPQRYPDYQLLDQQKGLERALDMNVYDSERIFHPDYDDFGETAFGCGGLYITKRSLWNLVRQDEALFHCEWEDISFGLDCQRRGLPLVSTSPPSRSPQQLTPCCLPVCIRLKRRGGESAANCTSSPARNPRRAARQTSSSR